MSKPVLEPFSPTLPHSAKERWVCIYPCYINSRRTRARGRKISIEQGVDNPKNAEVKFILEKLSLEYLLENKVHPKELDSTEPLIHWRIRVHLKNDDGSPVNEQFPDRHSLLLYLGKTIPIIRAKRAPIGATPGTSEQSNQGKKGKKKRK
ncbi:unnamed protein product [Calicophoron daubneyi]|uniref:Signal recognition particle 19 kDa protein n=1 Tax=Calicophoron daubneyi TaxID=300641 RepID=A0AAV2TPW3_CALDB